MNWEEQFWRKTTKPNKCGGYILSRRLSVGPQERRESNHARTFAIWGYRIASDILSRIPRGHSSFNLTQGTPQTRTWIEFCFELEHTWSWWRQRPTSVMYLHLNKVVRFFLLRSISCILIFVSLTGELDLNSMYAWTDNLTLWPEDLPTSRISSLLCITWPGLLFKVTLSDHTLVAVVPKVSDIRHFWEAVYTKYIYERIFSKRFWYELKRLFITKRWNSNTLCMCKYIFKEALPTRAKRSECYHFAVSDDPAAARSQKRSVEEEEKTIGKIFRTGWKLHPDTRKCFPVGETRNSCCESATPVNEIREIPRHGSNERAPAQYN